MSDEVISEVPPAKKPAMCKKCGEVPVPSLGADHGLCNACWWAAQRTPPAPPAVESPPAPSYEEVVKEYHDTATFACSACKEREQRERQMGAMLARAPDQPLPDVLTFPPRSGSFVILPGDVTDGDTLAVYWLIADKARLFGCNAPETHGPHAKAAQDAKAALEILVSDHGPLRADVHGREKYGRALLDIKLPDGRSVSAVMVQLGMAVAWDGHGPRPD